MYPDNDTSDTSQEDTFEQQFVFAINLLFNMGCCAFFLGTLLNLWFIIATASCRQLRTKFTNQLICNLMILHLVQSLIKSPVQIFYTHLLKRDWNYNSPCDLTSFVLLHEIYPSFIGDCLLVLIMMFIMFKIACVDISRTLKMWILVSARSVLHLLPWAASVALIYLLRRFFTTMQWCFGLVLFGKTMEISIPIMAMLPNVLCVVILVTALFLFKHKRATVVSGDVNNSSYGAFLPLAMVVAVIINIGCSVPLMICVIKLAAGDSWSVVDIAISCCVSQARVVLMLIPWLIMPDIRETLLKWRLCQCTSNSQNTHNQTELNRVSR